MSLEYRMYGLVPYQLTGIQQGIQFGHAVVEYSLYHFHDADYKTWANTNKTFIILNGGFSSNSINKYTGELYIGSMEKNLQLLIDNQIKISTFYEPDLNSILSAIVFLVDERVFLRDKYPDFQFKIDQTDLMNPIFTSNDEKDKWVEWIESIGGKNNLFLRTFLYDIKGSQKFRLA